MYRIQGASGAAAGDLSGVLEGHVYGFGKVGRSGAGAPPGLLSAIDFSDQSCLTFDGATFGDGGPSCAAVSGIYGNGMGVAYVPEADGSYNSFITAIGGAVQLTWRAGAWLALPGAPLNHRPASKQWSWKPLTLFTGGRRALLLVNQFAEEGTLDDSFQGAIQWMSDIPDSFAPGTPAQDSIFHTLFLADGPVLRELHVPGLDIGPGAGATVAAAMDVDGDGEPEVAFTLPVSQDPQTGTVMLGVQIGRLVTRDALGNQLPGATLSIRLSSPAPGTRATATCGAQTVVDEIFAEAGMTVPPSTELLLGCPSGAALTDLTIEDPAGNTLLQVAEQPLGCRLVVP